MLVLRSTTNITPGEQPAGTHRSTSHSSLFGQGIEGPKALPSGRQADNEKASSHRVSAGEHAWGRQACAAFWQVSSTGQGVGAPNPDPSALQASN
jgi:hypothetical protein